MKRQSPVRENIDDELAMQNCEHNACAESLTLIRNRREFFFLEKFAASKQNEFDA